jgi:hypothetical protein
MWHNGYALDRATVRQKKTGRPVRFELTDQSRAIDEYLRLTGLRAGQLLFPGRRDAARGMTTRQYARLVREWVANIGLDPAKFGTHSLRRTKAVLIYRRTGNLRAIQLLLGHSKIESTCATLVSRSTTRSRSQRRSIFDRHGQSAAALPIHAANTVEVPPRADMGCVLSDGVSAASIVVRLCIWATLRAKNTPNPGTITASDRGPSNALQARPQ